MTSVLKMGELSHLRVWIPVVFGLVVTGGCDCCWTLRPIVRPET